MTTPPSIQVVSTIVKVIVAGGTLQMPTIVSDSPTPFSFVSSEESIMTIDGEIGTYVAAGTTTITASQPANEQFKAGSTSFRVTLVANNPVFSPVAALKKNYGQEAFVLPLPTSTSNGSITLSSSDSSVLQINGNTGTILKAGNVTVTAQQASTPYYKAAFTTYKVNVDVGTATVSYPNVVIQYVDIGTPIPLELPTSPSSAPLAIVSNDTNIATISGAGSHFTVTGLQPGITTATVTQEEQYYYYGPITSTFTIRVNPPTSLFTDIPNVSTVYSANGLVPLPTVGSVSSAPIIFQSLDETVATVVGENFVIKGAGTASIQVHQNATADYPESTSTLILTVEKAEPYITRMAQITQFIYSGATKIINSPSSESDGVFGYTFSNSSVATISGNVLTFKNVGNGTLTATQTASRNYKAKSVTCQVAVIKNTPTLSWIPNFTKTTADSSFNIVRPTTNGLSNFIFSSSNPSVATMVGRYVSMKGITGTTTITAVSPASSNYHETSISVVMTVTKSNATILLPKSLTIPYGSTPRLAIPRSNNLTSSFGYDSSETNVFYINADRYITPVGLGSATLHVSQESNSRFNLTTVNVPVTIIAGPPQLSNINDVMANLGDEDFDLVPPTSTSLGAWTFEGSNSRIASITSSGRVTVKCPGTIIVRANQAALGGYIAAKTSYKLTVTLSPPVLTGFPNSTHYLGDTGSFYVSLEPPLSNSNGSWKYTSSNSAIAEVVSSRLLIKAPGLVTVTAIQAATTFYSKAEKTKTVSIGLTNKKQANLFMNPITMTYGSEGPLLFKSISNGDITFSIEEGADNVTLVNNGKNSSIKADKVGNGIIKVTQSETLEYASDEIFVSFSVLGNPTIISNWISDIGVFPRDNDAEIILPGVGSNRTGVDALVPIIFTSDDETIAYLDSNNNDRLRFTGKKGTTKINAIQAATEKYAEGKISINFSCFTIDFSSNSPSNFSFNNRLRSLHNYTMGGSDTDYGIAVLDNSNTEWQVCNIRHPLFYDEILPFRVKDVAYSKADETYIAIGTNNVATANALANEYKLAKSTDGINWTGIYTKQTLGTVRNLSGIIYANGKWVILSDNTLSRCHTSSDNGITWEEVIESLFNNYTGYKGIMETGRNDMYGNMVYVTSTNNICLTTSNFSDNKNFSAASLDGGAANFVSGGNGQFIMGGSGRNAETYTYGIGFGTPRSPLYGIDARYIIEKIRNGGGYTYNEFRNQQNVVNYVSGAIIHGMSFVSAHISSTACFLSISARDSNQGIIRFMKKGEAIQMTSSINNYFRANAMSFDGTRLVGVGANSSFIGTVNFTDEI